MEERSLLALLRMRKGWSLAHAATLLDVGINTLNRWELGHQRPHGYNLQKLGEVYGVPLDKLGFDGEIAVPDVGTAHTPLFKAFLTGDLSMRLLTLAFTPHRTYTEVQAKVSLILEEFDAMNIDPMTRREALKRLAALSMLPLYPALPNVQQSSATLTQCAAAIAACQELGRGKDAMDLALAFEGTSTVLEILEPIIKDSSRLRKAAATLAAQAARVQAILARHLQGARAALRYGQQAVLYSKESGDVPEHLMALIVLAWEYSYIPQYTQQALHTMEQALSILKEQRAKVPLYIQGQVYGALAVMQAKNGLSGDVAHRLAVKNAFADQGYTVLLDDPVMTLIKDEADILYYNGEQNKALDSLSQLIDIESKDRNGNLLLSSKRAMSEREHLGVLSRMTFASLKGKNKELERSVSLWRAQVQVVKALKSEQRFEEAILAYQMMDTLWGDDSRVKDLRPLTVHW
jgi:transcriptional regulator with XRE-family HTH domain